MILDWLVHFGCEAPKQSCRHSVDNDSQSDFLSTVTTNEFEVTAGF